MRTNRPILYSQMSKQSTGDARGGEEKGREQLPPVPLPLPLTFWLPPPPPGKILIVTKCPLVIIHMPSCDLLNVIFAKHHRYL